MKNKHTTDTRPIEEAYFHTGNSGITARVIETVRTYDENRTKGWPKHSYDHRLEFVHGAMGFSSTFSTPILSPDMIDIYIAMLTRTKDRMAATPDYRSYHQIEDSDRRRVMRVMNGQTLEEVWSPEIVDSLWSTSTYFLGHNLIENGVAVGFRPYSGPQIARGSDSCGTSDDAEAPYRYTDIGKPVAEVERERASNARIIDSQVAISTPAMMTTVGANSTLQTNLSDTITKLQEGFANLESRLDRQSGPSGKNQDGTSKIVTEIMSVNSSVSSDIKRP